jgi:hypothetical protein
MDGGTVLPSSHEVAVLVGVTPLQALPSLIRLMVNQQLDCAPVEVDGPGGVSFGGRLDYAVVDLS